MTTVSTRVTAENARARYLAALGVLPSRNVASAPISGKRINRVRMFGMII
jgi:hypothetical protein